MTKQSQGSSLSLDTSSLFGIKPFFLASSQGELFSTYLAPMSGKPLAGVLFAPPFAEEMHKSRRMCALQMRQLAREGYSVLQIDLPGCGDSAGEFAEASWEGWLDGLHTAHDWLRGEIDGPIVLWGLRLGAALVVELSARLPEIAGLILWQPVVNGEVFLNQFLRVKLAGEMLAEGKSQLGLKGLRGQLEQGEPLEVGGNMLNPRLALRIDALRLAQMPVTAPVHWLELASAGDASLSPAGARVVAEWSTRGTTVFAQALLGDPFWATQEITESPALIPATSHALAKLLA